MNFEMNIVVLIMVYGEYDWILGRAISCYYSIVSLSTIFADRLISRWILLLSCIWAGYCPFTHNTFLLFPCSFSLHMTLTGPSTIKSTPDSTPLPVNLILGDLQYPPYKNNSWLFIHPPNRHDFYCQATLTHISWWPSPSIRSHLFVLHQPLLR